MRLLILALDLLKVQVMKHLINKASPSNNAHIMYYVLHLRMFLGFM